jgi:tryptophan synthase beta chain
LAADLPVPLPAVLHPGTLQPVGPDDLAPLFPMSLIAQEVSTERYIEIPEPVQEVFRQWRPSPLFRARFSKPSAFSAARTAPPSLLFARALAVLFNLSVSSRARVRAP